MKLLQSSRSAVAYRLWQLRPPKPALTVVCKHTFALAPGTCNFADEPAPCGGEVHDDDDDTRSLRHADALAFFKPLGGWLIASDSGSDSDSVSDSGSGSDSGSDSGSGRGRGHGHGRGRGRGRGHGRGRGRGRGRGHGHGHGRGPPTDPPSPVRTS